MSDVAAWIRAKLAEHAPEATSDQHAALEVGHAWAALTGRGKEIFGMEIPDDVPDRDALRDECLALIRRWIPLLDKPTKDLLRQLMTGYAVPLGHS